MATWSYQEPRQEKGQGTFEEKVQVGKSALIDVKMY